MTINNQIALVTGGTRGIGRATSIALARTGATVAINYKHNDTAAEALYQEISAQGLNCRLYKCDITDAAQTDQMVTNIENELGNISILVNNAGLANQSFLMLTSSEKWDQLLATNLTGTFNITKRVIKSMISQKYGRIINISSISAIKGTAGNSCYSATKAALLGFSRSLAVEVGRYNILVNTVLPGLIETDMTATQPQGFVQENIARTPLGRIGRPQEIADVITFLASEQASFITGQALVVDGGLSC